MMLFGVFCVLVSFVISEPSDVEMERQFSEWMVKHQKIYASDEDQAHAFENFRASLVRVLKQNQRTTELGKGATYDLNRFSDLSPEEFRRTFLAKPFHPTPKETRSAPLSLDMGLAALPTAFDWRTKGAVTPVKDQGQCGSCWAFSVTENIESVWMLAKGINSSAMAPLAPQQIVDCDKVDAGCNGGDTPTAFEYVIKAGGQDTEASYPYKAIDQACHFKAADVEAKIASYKYATKTKNEAEMKDAVATVAPLSICVDAEPWQFYTSGVMTKAQCGTSLDHCVQITAYDTAAKPAYWKVRNSWGADWGEKGFIRLEYGTNTCGVAEEPTTAVV
eukprot:TRINITY_DN528_c0_g1_i2.p1 TRINITY_DN528_c0_g1~~TRINITY_DN528_c0_g1_i2.p1  ORF type:complete len:333 (+),score=26.74 TRINITY_DN528_c0_g1_i2:40-1038(+)